MPSRDFYGADFAELYDLFHGSKPYKAEARFVRDMAHEILGTVKRPLRLLDVACGTGSHAVELSRLGFAVTGIDSSREMLLRARRKAAAAKRDIRFECQDLTKLSLPGESFDVVTCLFDSIGYLRTDARIARALRRMRDLLDPGGLLFLEVWHAPAMLGGFEPVRIRRVHGEGIEGVRIGETRLRPERKVGEVRYEVFHKKQNGPWRHFVETHVTRFFTSSEITDLLRGAGFRIDRILGGYSESAPPIDDAWHLMVIAEGR
jgi:SAM-dependent methyltransferase